MAISPCFDQIFFPTWQKTPSCCTQVLLNLPHVLSSLQYPPPDTHTASSQIHALYCQSPGGLCSSGFSLSPSVVFAVCALCPIRTSCVGGRCMCQILSALERFCLQGLNQEQPRLTSTFTEWKTKRVKEANYYHS